MTHLHDNRGKDASDGVDRVNWECMRGSTAEDVTSDVPCILMTHLMYLRDLCNFTIEKCNILGCHVKTHQLVDLRERWVLNVQPVCGDPVQSRVIQHHLTEQRQTHLYLSSICISVEFFFLHIVLFYHNNMTEKVKVNVVLNVHVW